MITRPRSTLPHAALCHPALIVLIAVGFALPLAAAATLAGAVAADRPNLILILADDLGYGDVGFHGSTQIPTPNLDRLAASGVRCSQAYVSAPVCAPSRAGLLTGRNQVEFGFDNNLGAPQRGFDPEFAGLPVEERTLADRLRAAGYATGLFGKWHLGERPQFHPRQRGFDEFWGFLGGAEPYFPPASGDRSTSRVECSFGPVGPLTYLTDDITTQSIAFMQRHRTRPFFLFASYNAPHAPLQARDEDLARFAGIADLKRRTYCAMVARFDHEVGRLLRAVEEEGMAARTLIVFLSDNGGPVDQNSSLNAPLNGQKGTVLEGGLRVPCVLSWPGRLPAGRVYAHPVSSLDFAPTVLARAGASADLVRGLTGTDLWTRLTGSDPSPPDRALRWRFTVSAAIREGDWKLIRLPDRLPLLFNVREDQAEQNDVALQHLDLTRTLLGKLGDWDARLPHPVFLEGAEWKHRQLDLYDATYPRAQPQANEAPPRLIPAKPAVTAK
ncbi:MAG: sulfatase-like hydrolase/transferase [Opitutaceae bacterium]|nr:sulfatase-like hydrolase/transferase [Opitutaceae bacterium]